MGAAVAITDDTHGSSVREMSCDVLVAHHADDERRTFRMPSLQVGRQRASAFRIVCGIEQHPMATVERESARAAPATAAASSPCSIASREIAMPRAAATSSSRTATTALPTWCSPRRPSVTGPYVACGVSCVTRARPSIISASQRVSCAASTSVAPRSAAHCADDVARLRAQSAPITTVMPGLMMPAFSNAIALERVAEMLLVIEVDGGDRAGHRRDHVGRIEASAESDLDHANLRRPRGETARMRPPSSPRKTSAAPAARRWPADDRRSSSTSVHDGLERRGIDGTIVDDESLGEIAQVRRGVARRRGLRRRAAPRAPSP